MFDKLQGFFSDPKREQEYQEFERKYRENPDEISQTEAANRFREIMSQADDNESDEELQQYEEAFGHLTPEQRRDLARRYLAASEDGSRAYHGQATSRDLEEASSPAELGKMTKRAAKKDPDLLEQLLGEDSPLAGRTGKMVLAGLAAFAASRFLGRS